MKVTWWGAVAFLVLATVGSGRTEVDITARETPRVGERCIVCDAPLVPEDPVLIVKGRRVPVAAEMEEVFLADPERYFSALQPRAALFTEDFAGSPMDADPMRTAWFWTGLWVLTALLAAGATAYLAVSRGRPPGRWFTIGLIGHVAGLVGFMLFGGRGDVSRVPAGLAKVPTTAVPGTCPSCGLEIHPNAARCASCGAKRKPVQSSEAQRALGGSR